MFPEAGAQRDWVHKVANVLDALPKTAQRTARKALAEIRDAADREHAERAIDAFAELFGAKYPKAVAKVVDDAAQLLACYDFPAEHWLHLKTSNPTWVHLRHRQATHQEAYSELRRQDRQQSLDLRRCESRDADKGPSE